MPSAFQIERDGKIFNYRDGEQFNEQELRFFFEQKGYLIESVQVSVRHAIVHLQRSGKEYCAKVSTSFGVGLMTQQEVLWNTTAEKHLPVDAVFTVPTVIEAGEFPGKRTYYITDWVKVALLAPCPPSHHFVPSFTLSRAQIEQICRMTEQIEALPVHLPIPDESLQSLSHTDIFVEKTRRWLAIIPETIPEYAIVQQLFAIVEGGAPWLHKTVRHGDVAPWHLQLLSTGKILLFDGEHAHSHSVEGYDICYFIQRVYSVLQSQQTALDIFATLLQNGHDQKKLQTVLAARAIGGFCDESLVPNPEYDIARQFGNWVLSL